MINIYHSLVISFVYNVKSENKPRKFRLNTHIVIKFKKYRKLRTEFQDIRLMRMIEIYF